MRLLLNVILLLLFFTTSSQSDYKILIDGHVISNIDKGPIVNAHVFLATNIGGKQECISDSSGYYHFKFKNCSFKTATLTIEVDKQTVQAKTGRTSLLGSSFLGSKDYGMFEIKNTESVNHFIKDFELVYIICNYMTFPEIYFKKNSIVFDTIKRPLYNSYDSLLNFPYEAINLVVQVLNENPEIITEFSANSSFDEKDPVGLSLSRVEKVKSEFIKRGIQEKRILTRGQGCGRLLVKESEIKKTNNKEEKAALHARNRRCTFAIASWDYLIDPNKPKDKKEEKEDE